MIDFKKGDLIRYSSGEEYNVPLIGIVIDTSDKCITIKFLHKDMIRSHIMSPASSDWNCVKLLKRNK